MDEPSSVSWVHGDEDGHVRIDGQLLADKFDGDSLLLAARSALFLQSFLDGLREEEAEER